MLVGQYDCDVTIAESGVIDPQRVIAQVERLIAAGKGSKWGVLDFEEPFDALWDAGDSDPRYRPALASMVATIRAERPLSSPPERLTSGLKAKPGRKVCSRKPLSSAGMLPSHIG